MKQIVIELNEKATAIIAKATNLQAAAQDANEIAQDAEKAAKALRRKADKAAAAYAKAKAKADKVRKAAFDAAIIGTYLKDAAANMDAAFEKMNAALNNAQDAAQDAEFAYKRHANAVGISAKYDANTAQIYAAQAAEYYAKAVAVLDNLGLCFECLCKYSAYNEIFDTKECYDMFLAEYNAAITNYNYWYAKIEKAAQDAKVFAKYDAAAAKVQKAAV